MKINIIGGSGFIGTRLGELLEAEGHDDFRIVDKQPSARFGSRCTIADVRSVEALRQAIEPGSYIVNLAAEHQDNVLPVELYEEVNVHGARNICTVARENGVNAILFTSSVAVYGNAEVGADETTPFRPFNEYGRTKAAAEEVFRAWHAEDPQCRTLVIVRPTVVFGEGNRGNVFNLLRQIHSRRFLMIGRGRNFKSMAYVGNVAAFLRHCLQLRPGLHVSNYVDKPDFSTRELVCFIRRCMGMASDAAMALPFPLALALGSGIDIVAKLTNRQFPISALRIHKFCSNSSFSTNASALGFKAPYPLREALRLTIASEFPAQ